MPGAFLIRPAAPADVPHILAMVRELAEFERLSHLVKCTADDLHRDLFGTQACIEAMLGWDLDEAGNLQPVAYTVCFRNYSTFLGRPGLYLEDLYVRPAWRKRGHARRMLAHLARLAVDRGCGRFEWSVLEWNEGAQSFYRSLGADILPDWRITRLTGATLERLAREDRP